jgi:alkanesulfonate monooxygenase SsuD/methylene tetrahydromethanopterin reductase-like flavin-dependent oxidoreductase (luciferase family)
MKIGLDLPQILPLIAGSVPGVKGAAHEILDFARDAEDLGYDGLWVHEAAVGPVPSLEPLTVLAAAAAGTTTLRLGTLVLLSPIRPPVALAKALASLDWLCGGRLVAGLALGPGGGTAEIYGSGGGHPGERFTELLKIVRRVWVDEPVWHEGTYWRLDGVSIQPKPLQPSGPPLWVGGRSDAALVRAARLADGWIGSGASSLDETAEDIARLRRELERFDRAADDYAIARRLYVVLDSQPGRARERHRAWFKSAYANGDLADRALVAGDIKDVESAVRTLEAIGVSEVILSPLEHMSEHMYSLAALKPLFHA